MDRGRRSMTSKENCPFCSFEDAEVVVHEDEISYVIVPLHPINAYHTLVIPKDHFIDFTDLPENVAAHIFLTAKKISEAVRKVCQPDAITHISDDDIYRKGYNLMEHYKFHIIPRFDDDNVRIDWGNPGDPGPEARGEYARMLKAVL